MTTTLAALAQTYRQLDEKEKEAKKAKEQLRPQLLALMTTEVESTREPLKEVVTITAADLEPYGSDVRLWATKKFPTYHVTEFSTEDGDTYTVHLEENLELTKFEFESDGYKFGRNVAMVGASFEAAEYLDALMHDRYEVDDDVLQDLLSCVSAKERVEVDYEVDEDKIVALVSEHPETLSIFQQFTNPGKPQVSMLPVRIAEPVE